MPTKRNQYNLVLNDDLDDTLWELSAQDKASALDTIRALLATHPRMIAQAKERERKPLTGKVARGGYRERPNSARAEFPDPEPPAAPIAQEPPPKQQSRAAQPGTQTPEQVLRQRKLDAASKHSVAGMPTRSLATHRNGSPAADE